MNNECVFVPCAESGSPPGKSSFIFSCLHLSCTSVGEKKKKSRCELDSLYKAVHTRKYELYFCTLVLNTKNTACSVRSCAAHDGTETSNCSSEFQRGLMVLARSFSSLFACFYALKPCGRLSLLIPPRFMHTQPNKEQIQPLQLRMCVIKLLCNIEIQAWSLTIPQQLHLWPWWILLSFMFLSVIYYLHPAMNFTV